MKISEFRKLIREEIKNAVSEKRNTPRPNALELTVDKIMSPVHQKAVQAADEAVLASMKELENQIKGKTISIPGQFQGTIVGVIPTMKSTREQGQLKEYPSMKSAEPGIKVKITNVEPTNKTGFAKVGKVVNLDYFYWINEDAELMSTSGTTQEAVSITGDFNDMDFSGPAKKEAMAYVKTPEGIKAIGIFKKLVSQPFDAADLTNAIKKAKFTKMNHFRAAALKGGLELDNLGMDNAGNGDFSVENGNYEDQGAAIAFFSNKFGSVG